MFTRKLRVASCDQSVVQEIIHSLVCRQGLKFILKLRTNTECVLARNEEQRLKRQNECTLKLLCVVAVQIVWWEGQDPGKFQEKTTVQKDTISQVHKSSFGIMYSCC